METDLRKTLFSIQMRPKFNSGYPDGIYFPVIRQNIGLMGICVRLIPSGAGVVPGPLGNQSRPPVEKPKGPPSAMGALGPTQAPPGDHTFGENPPVKLTRQYSFRRIHKGRARGGAPSHEGRPNLSHMIENAIVMS
jgi:hypothetical protein